MGRQVFRMLGFLLIDSELRIGLQVQMCFFIEYFISRLIEFETSDGVPPVILVMRSKVARASVPDHLQVTGATIKTSHYCCKVVGVSVPEARLLSTNLEKNRCGGDWGDFPAHF